jgi:16S rRNA (cytosine967-C5)-methyltransferase
MKNQGRLVAFDIYDDKIDELRRRARRAGLTNARAVVVVPEKLGETFEALGLAGACDRVLVDAPCSGLGVVRRNPESRWRLTAADVDELVRKQREILAAYAPLVAPGGRLVYATCTVLSAENDGAVRAFLDAHPDFSVMTAKEILGAARAAEIGDGTFLRCYPHRHGTDGFFAAVLRRRK